MKRKIIMKIKIIIGLIKTVAIYFILLAFDVHPFRYKHNSFHVRIGCLDEDMPSFLQGRKWAYDNPVYFTNNNWATETAIMTTFDISNDWSGGNNVAYLKWLSDGDRPQIAIDFAKKLHSYKQCLDYNDTVVSRRDRLQAYRDLHQIPQKKEPKKDNCCNPIFIK